MLTDDELDLLITLHAPPIHPDFKDDDDFIELARAIEAAVLPEGWVAVPKEPTLAMLGCLRSDITSNLEKRYQAMLAAAPKPAQASPLDLMECLQDRPVEPSKAVQGKCVVQAEKQEPVKDEPVAFFIVEQWMHYEQASKDTPGAFPVFTRPQPDLTAEVERLKGMVSEIQAARFVMNQHDQHVKRIAELEEAAREARDSAICECIKVAEEEAKDLEKLRDIALARQESATIEATNILAINRCIELMKTMSSSA